MKTTSSAQPPADEIPPEETARRVVHGVSLIDADRAAAYAGLRTLHGARASALDREQRLLSRKYGSEHPRVAAVAERRAANAVVLRDLAVAHVLAATPLPTVDERGYVFHGFVRDRQRQPLPRLTVALYNEKGEWISELGYGCTDEKGYFLLRFQREQKREGASGDQPSPESSPSVAAAFSAGNTSAATAPRDPSSGPTVEIRVYNANQKLVHREADPLYPRLGAIDFREIVIAEAAACTPPPGAPNQPPPPPPREKPDTGSDAPRPGRGTPLENIKGIGPVRATALRKLGIADVETLLKTPTEKLVGIAGFDADVAKREARKTLRDTPEKPPS